MALTFGSLSRLITSSYKLIFKLNRVNIVRSSRVVLSQSLCLSCFHSSILPFLEIKNQLAGGILQLPLHSPILSIFQRRDKSTKKKKQTTGYETESDSDDEVVAQITGSKVVKAQSDSLRSDAVLRHGLGLSRNKFDVLFYESRMRVNGAKLRKRNQNVQVGDEIDIVKDFSQENPKLIFVSRIEVLDARPSGDFILLTLRRTKTMLIENYEIDPWEGLSPENEKNSS